MFKKYYLGILCLLFSINILAQTNISSYGFSKTTGNTYTEITGGTAYVAGTYDNNISGAIQLGDTFTFGGANFTQIYISGNGFISFGAAPTGTNYTPISSLGSTTGVISAFGQDGSNSTVSGSTPEIRYENLGSEFVVQWKDHANYYNRTVERLNFQIRLNFNTNEISIHYGNCTNPGSVSTSGTAIEVGLRGNSTTFSSNVNNLMIGNVPAANTCDWSKAATGNSNSSTMLFSGSTNVNVNIPNGLKFTWIPQSGLNPVRSFSAISAITANSAKIKWTAPSGATQYNVQYKAVGSCDWTDWASNPVMADSLILTGLSQTTTYQYRVQASNGTINSIWSHIPNTAGNGNGYVTNGSFSTPATCPPPTALTVGSLTASSAAANWTAGGSETMWYVYYGASPLTAPNASTLPTDSSTANSYNFSGLNQLTAYSVYVRANCGSGDLSSWTSVANFTTLATCPPPTALTTSSITSNSAAASWTAGGTETMWYVYYGPTPLTAPVDSTLPTDSTMINSYNLINLSANTNYGVYVRGNCGSGDLSPWTSVANFTTPCNPIASLPWTENFDALTTLGTSNFPACWVKQNGDWFTANDATNTYNNSRSTPNYLTNNWSASDEFIWTPKFSLTAGKSYEFSFYMSTDGLSGWTNVGVYTSLNQNGTGANLVGSLITSPTNTAYVKVTRQYTASATEDISFGIRLNATGNPWYIAFDDFSLIEIPDAPPAIQQSAATPSCSSGSEIFISGTPALNTLWYWQTNASDTSRSNLVNGNYTIFTNGTYYAKTVDTITGLWSLNASSITISNIPVAPLPPSPTAGANPACNSTDVSVPVSATPGVKYYWQTMMNGVDTLNPVTAPLTITASDSIYVAAFDSTSSCWSNTSVLYVQIDNYTPALPTVSSDIIVCTGASSAEFTAEVSTVGQVEASFGTNLVSPGTPVTFNATLPAIPAGATLTSANLVITNAQAVNGSWRSEMRVALSGAVSLTATQLSTLNSGGSITPDPSIALSIVAANGGSVTLTLSETYNDPGVDDATFGEIKIIVNYTPPASNITWWDSATGGNQIGTGSPFETVGSAVLANTLTPGTYNFYAQSSSGACVNSTRQNAVVTVSEILIGLEKIDVTCNGANNGSFVLDTVICGTPPFTYSINNGTFGAIPTNLGSGQYSIIVKDSNDYQTLPIVIDITEPNWVVTAPTIANDSINICLGATSAVIDLDLQSLLIPSTSQNLIIPIDVTAAPSETNASPGVTFASFNMPTLPTGAVINNVVFSYPGIEALGGSWRADINIGFTGAINNNAAIGDGAQNSSGIFTYTRTIPGSAVNGAGNVNIVYWDAYNDNTNAEALFPIGIGVATVNISYTVQNSITWFDAATAGNNLGTGGTFETVGTTLLPDANTLGSFTFYAEAENNGCFSANRLPVTITVNPNPTAPSATGATICSGETATVSATGNSITWFDDTITGTLLGSGSNYTTAALAASTSVYAQDNSNVGCASPRTAVAITVNPSAAAPTVMGTDICSGNTAAISATSAAAAPSVLLVENFDYPEDTLLTGPLAGWTQIGTTTTNPLEVSSPGLNSAGYIQSGIGNKVTAIQSGQDVYKSFTTQTSGSVYASFMLTPLAATATADYNIAFLPSASTSNFTSRLYTKLENGSIHFGIGKSGTPATYVGGYQIGTTYVVVMKYTFVAGTTNDEVNVYIFPSGIPYSEPSTPTLTINTTTDAVDIGRIAIRQGTFANGLNQSIDGIRVFTNWSELNTGNIKWYDAMTGGNLLANSAGYTTPVLNATTTYYAQDETALGCESPRVPVVVTVNPTPSAPTASNTATCTGTSATLTATGSGTLGWYTAATGGTYIGGGASVNSPALTAATSYFVQDSSAFGCVSQRTQVDVTINNPTVITTQPIGGAICEGSAGQFTSAATGSGTITYQWYKNGSILTGVTTPTLTTSSITLADAGTYYVEATGTCGTVASNSVVLVVNPKPVASFTSGTVNCTNGPVQFNNTSTISSGSINTYNWSFGNTLTSTNVNPSTTYASTGNYNVQLIISSFEGCLDTASAQITVVAGPTVTASTLTPAICEGGNAILTASGATTYAWQANPTLSGTTGTSVTATPANTTTYTVIGSESNGCSSSASVTVTVNPNPVLSFNQSPAALCGPQTASIYVSGADTYNWVTDPTITQNFGDSILINPTTSTVYSVTGTITTTGCATSTNYTVSILPLPQVNLGSVISVCDGNTVILNAGNGFVTYAWNTGDTMQSISTDSAGIYSVIVTDANGCSGTDDVAVVINPNPVVNLGNNVTSCSNQTVTLNAGNGFVSYDWSNGATTQTINPTNTGNYIVNVLDNNGCVGTDTVFVTINQAPIINLGADTTICLNGRITYFFPGYTSTVWSTGETTTSIVLIGDSLNLGANTISLTVTDANTCTGTDEIVITVSECVGVEETVFSDGINLYPNPSRNFVNINVNKELSGDVMLMVYDQNGKLVYQNNTNSNGNFNHVINVEQYKAGIYTIQLVNGNQSASKRFVVQ